MLILASESPRRRELLKRIVPEFTVLSPQIEELEDGAELEKVPQENALLKAAAVAELYPEAFVLGADTAVFAGGKMLGKPASEAEASAMLRSLSGRTHKVISGVALICRKKNWSSLWSEVSEVTFKELSSREIAGYMAVVNVLDKAGAYAIQEHPELLGATWKGELENIIGLPLVKLQKILQEIRGL